MRDRPLRAGSGASDVRCSFC
ncbi:MAG: hypothetical protein IKI81_01580, partial [Selenomonadaceae bacterium]|nr:hypothetical protein [Selenomonadaceae bacterium]